MRKLNLGMINFINGLVPDYRLESSEFEKVYDIPSRLNSKLRSGELDISPVSSMEYIQNPQLYKILPGLGISSPGYADTVGVFSTMSPEEWDKKPLFVTGSSLTSVYLLKVLAKKYLKIEPKFVIQDSSEALSEDLSTLSDRYCGGLLIGDRAIEMKHVAPEQRYFDLAQLWKGFTGFDFVFALWLVRSDFVSQNEALVQRFWELQKMSVELGLEHLDELYEKSSGLYSRQAFKRYFHEYLNYDLNSEARAGLNRFIKDLHELGFIHKEIETDFSWEVQSEVGIEL